jgi:hypothetical protein
MRTLLAILLAAALVGCEAPEPSHTDPAIIKRNQSRLAVAAVGAENIRDSMNDPESFKLTSAFIVEATGSVCYGFRARNQFGGVGTLQAVYSPAKGGVKTSEMSGFRTLWDRECKGKQGFEWVESVVPRDGWPAS